MKKRSCIIFYAGLCLFLLSSETLQATHVVGAELTYAYDTLNQYTVTVKFYRNCGDSVNPNPAPAPLTVDISFSSASCGNAGFISISQVPGTGQEIPTGLFPGCDTTACNGGTGYGVLEYIYRGSITIPFACSDWVMAAAINARTATITTLSNPGVLSLYVEATLDNLNYPGNSSPVFSTLPVSRLCLNQTSSYNQGATDPDGDSLVFTLVDALNSNLGVPPVSSPVPYISPYSGANPISSNPPISIDPQTGSITVTPNLIQIGVVAILVQEYRNGVMIGSARRDMQLNIEAFCNIPPAFQTTTFNNSVLCGDSILRFKLGMAVQCTSVASDASDFRMISPTNNPIPLSGAFPLNCNTAGLTDSIEIRLFAPDLSQNGAYTIWTKIGSDGNTLLNSCNLSMAEYDTAFFIMNSCPVSIFEQEHELMYITIYPNPARDMLSVMTNSFGSKQLRVYNSIGEKIKEFEMMQSTMQLDISDFSNGFYSLVVSKEMESRAISFIVRH